MAENKLPKINRQWRTWSLKSFHGGLNTKDSQTSLKMSELLQCRGAQVNALGRLVLSGRWKELDDYEFNGETKDFYPGSGLYNFKSDYRLLNPDLNIGMGGTIEDTAAVYEKKGVDVILLQSGRFFHIRQQIGNEVLYLENAFSITGEDSSDANIESPLAGLSYFNAYFIEICLRIADGNFLNELDGTPLSKTLIFYNNVYFGEDSIQEFPELFTAPNLAILGGTGNINILGSISPARYSDRIYKPYMTHIPAPNNYVEAGSTALQASGSISQTLFNANSPGRIGVSCHLPHNIPNPGDYSSNEGLSIALENPWTGFFPISSYMNVAGHMYPSSHAGWDQIQGGSAFRHDHNIFHFSNFDNDDIGDGVYGLINYAVYGTPAPHYEFLPAYALEADDPGNFSSRYSYDPDASNWLAINDWAPYKEAYMKSLEGDRNYSSPIRMVFLDPHTAGNTTTNLGWAQYQGGSQWTPCWLSAPFCPGETPSYGKVSVFFDILGIYDPDGPYWDVASSETLMGYGYGANWEQFGIKFCISRFGKGGNGYPGGKVHGANDSELGVFHGGPGAGVVDNGYTPPPWEGIKTLSQIMKETNPEWTQRIESYGTFPWRDCHWGTVDNLGAYDSLGLGMYGGYQMLTTGSAYNGAIDMANFRFKYIPFGTQYPFFPLDFRLTITRVQWTQDPNQDLTEVLQDIIVLKPHDPLWFDQFGIDITPYSDSDGNMHPGIMHSHWFWYNTPIEDWWYFMKNRHSPTLIEWKMSNDAHFISLSLGWNSSYIGQFQANTLADISSIIPLNQQSRGGIGTWHGVNYGYDEYPDLYNLDSDLASYDDNGYPTHNLTLGGRLNQGQLIDPITNMFNFSTEEAVLAESFDGSEYYGVDTLNLDFSVGIDDNNSGDVGNIEITYSHAYAADGTVAYLDPVAGIIQSLYGGEAYTYGNDPSLLTGLNATYHYSADNESLELPWWDFQDWIVLNEQLPDDTIIYINNSNLESDVSSVEAIRITRKLRYGSHSDPLWDSDTIVKLFPEFMGYSGNELLALARDGIFNLETLEADGTVTEGNPVYGFEYQGGYDYISDFTGYVYNCERLYSGSNIESMISKTYLGSVPIPAFEQEFKPSSAIKINIENSSRYRLLHLHALRQGQYSAIGTWPYESQYFYNHIVSVLFGAADYTGSISEHNEFMKKLDFYGLEVMVDLLTKAYFPAAGDTQIERFHYFNSQYAGDVGAGGWQNQIKTYLKEYNFTEDLKQYEGTDGFNMVDFNTNNSWVFLPKDWESWVRTPLFFPIVESIVYDSNTDLAEDLTSNETGIDVGDGTKFAVDNIIQIGLEYMKVTNISSNVLTVIRGSYDERSQTRPNPDAHSNGDNIFIVPQERHVICGIVTPFYDSEQTKTNFQNAGIPGIEEHPIFLDDIEDIKVWFRSKFVEPYDEIVGQIFIDHWGSI